MAVLFCLPALAAGATPTPTLWDKAKTIMQDVYNKILGISTIAGIVAASIAPAAHELQRKNDRTVGESRAWLKRIIVSWAILNGLGFIIMSYITPFLPTANGHRNSRESRRSICLHPLKNGFGRLSINWQ